MSLTKTDLNQIENIVDKKLDKRFATFEKTFDQKLDEKFDEKLANYTTREELQMMMKAIDERFNTIESKMLDKDEFHNLIGDVMHEISENRIEREAVSQGISDLNDRVTKIESILPLDLAL